MLVAERNPDPGALSLGRRVILGNVVRRSVYPWGSGPHPFVYDRQDLALLEMTANHREVKNVIPLSRIRLISKQVWDRGVFLGELLT
jgi:hypothetical protein